MVMEAGFGNCAIIIICLLHYTTISDNDENWPSLLKSEISLSLILILYFPGTSCSLRTKKFVVVTFGKIAVCTKSHIYCTTAVNITCTGQIS
jgi:hypothetical protein